MTRVLLVISLLATVPALAGCVSAAAASCSFVDGQLTCSGNVAGSDELPDATPGI